MPEEPTANPELQTEEVSEIESIRRQVNAAIVAANPQGAGNVTTPHAHLTPSEFAARFDVTPPQRPPVLVGVDLAAEQRQNAVQPFDPLPHRPFTSKDKAWGYRIVPREPHEFPNPDLLGNSEMTKEVPF